MKKMSDYMEIRMPGSTFLYPKKRGSIQSLIELDDTGYEFYKLMKKGMTDAEMKKAICELYSLDEREYGEQILKDIQDFKESFIVEDDSSTGKADPDDVQRCVQGFFDQFLKLQTYYKENHKPFRFFIEITYNCNLRCRHCYRGEDVSSREMSSVFMKKEKIFQILDEMEKMGVVEVFITGGEPFTHPDIWEILEYASSKNLIVTVLTNGNFLTDPETVKKLKDFNIYDYRISVYGNKEHHDYMTQIPGSHDKSLKALRNINEILGLGTAAFVVTTANYDDCREVLSYFEGTTINVSMNSMLTPTAKGDLHPTGMRISPEQYRKMIVDFELPLSGSRCSAGLSRFRISPNGDVNPCELIPGHTFGNIYEKTLTEIMDSDERKEFIKMFEDVLENHPCNACEMKGECNFCPALFLQENGDFKKPIQYLCDITRQKREVMAEKGWLQK